MNNKELYHQLMNAYSDKNLNNITARIIDFYKSRQFERIREIKYIVSKYIQFEEEKINKCFSRLVMIYHPDRGNQYRGKIAALHQEGNASALNDYAHILEVQDMKYGTCTTEPVIEDIDYDPEYIWDFDNEGYTYFTDNGDLQDDLEDVFPGHDLDVSNSFFNAVKRKIYGTIQVEMPPYYLNDLDEIEMVDYEIEDLDGVAYCQHAIRMDLSGNNIHDIHELRSLFDLEELYLTGNQIELVDMLFHLKNLKKLDLSHNRVKDISALFLLDELEYLNIIGNPVPLKQIEHMKSLGVVVIH